MTYTMDSMVILGSLQCLSLLMKLEIRERFLAHLKE